MVAVETDRNRQGQSTAWRGSIKQQGDYAADCGLFDDRRTRRCDFRQFCAGTRGDASAFGAGGVVEERRLEHRNGADDQGADRRLKKERRPGRCDGGEKAEGDSAAMLNGLNDWSICCKEVRTVKRLKRSCRRRSEF